jgi:hypothetical protein
MPHPLEAAGQDMEEEPPKKLDGVQRHRPVAVAMGIVFPAKRHPPVLECQQAAIGDRHAMGIAREILQDRPRAADGGFGIHHPLGSPEGAQELLPPRGVSEGRALPIGAHFRFFLYSLPFMPPLAGHSIGCVLGL